MNKCQSTVTRPASNQDYGNEHAIVQTEGNQTAYAQVEIDVSTLYRLISEKKLFLEELHCLNAHSKNIIKQALLDSLTR